MAAGWEHWHWVVGWMGWVQRWKQKFWFLISWYKTKWGQYPIKLTIIYLFCIPGPLTIEDRNWNLDAMLRIWLIVDYNQNFYINANFDPQLWLDIEWAISQNHFFKCCVFYYSNWRSFLDKFQFHLWYDGMLTIAILNISIQNLNIKKNFKERLVTIENRFSLYFFQPMRILSRI